MFCGRPLKPALLLLILVGCVRAPAEPTDTSEHASPEGRQMTTDTQPGAHTRELIRNAWAAVAGVAPDETRQSMPIPVRQAGRLEIHFLFFPSRRQHPQPEQVFPPTHRVRLDATGALIEMSTVTPADLGHQDDPAMTLGDVKLKEGLTLEAYDNARDELMAALDVLLPAFAQDARNESLAPVARRAIEAMDHVRIRAASAYYDHAAAGFLTWTRSVAAGRSN